MMVIPAIANNQQVQGITTNTLTVLQNLTAQWVKDTVPNSTPNVK